MEDLEDALHEDKLGAGAKGVNFWGEVDVFAGGIPGLVFRDEFFSFLDWGVSACRCDLFFLRLSVDHVTQ